MTHNKSFFLLLFDSDLPRIILNPIPRHLLVHANIIIPSLREHRGTELYPMDVGRHPKCSHVFWHYARRMKLPRERKVNTLGAHKANL